MIEPIDYFEEAPLLLEVDAVREDASKWLCEVEPLEREPGKCSKMVRTLVFGKKKLFFLIFSITVEFQG